MDFLLTREERKEMFENYGRGDLAQYLESKGYYVENSDDIQALRIAG